jgi:nitroreductase
MGEPTDLLLTRRSIGKVAPDALPEAAVTRLLAAAVQAPNHHLTEPWRFIVLEGSARRRVGEAHAHAYRRANPAAGEDALERERQRLERAPTVVVCVLRTDQRDPVTAREDRDAVACAVQNILLAAHAEGLAAMWRTGPMVEEPDVHAALNLESGDQIVAFVYVGMPLSPAPDRPRSPLADVVDWRRE